MNVAFLPTGRTEWRGLSGAFTALFPGHTFDVLPSEEEVRSYPDSFPYNGFTSNRLDERHERTPPEAACELIERASQAALGDRNVSAADLVVILEDLELVNIDQPDRVARVLRAAVKQHIDSLGNENRGKVVKRTRDALLQRVSFHLLVPMVEALFFADPMGLQNAGVPAGSSHSFADSCDPEEFMTTDAAYLEATEAACPCWARLPHGQRKNLRPKWLGTARARHPKGYIQWLCRDGEEKNCTTYHETDDGGTALQRLDWRRVLERPAHHLRYLRALVADVADALGEQPPTSGQFAEDTSPFKRRPDPLLRNL